jgi:hypothetical protein
MALRLVQIAMNARDDSAVGRFWAQALGWGTDSEEPGVTGLEPVGFAYPDPIAAACVTGARLRLDQARRLFSRLASPDAANPDVAHD